MSYEKPAWLQDFESVRPSLKEAPPEPASAAQQSKPEPDEGPVLGTLRNMGSRLASLTVGNLAAAADLVLGLPVDLAGIAAEGNIRREMSYDPLNPRPRGELKTLRAESDAEIGKRGAARKAEIRAKYGEPFKKLMRDVGVQDIYDAAEITQAMNYLGSKIEQGGEAVEKATGGKWSKETVLALVDQVMVGAGAAGVPPTARAISKRLPGAAAMPAGETGIPANLQPPKGPVSAETATKLSSPVGRRRPAAGDVSAARAALEAEAAAAAPAAPAAPRAPTIRAKTREEMADLEKAERVARDKKREDVRAAFLEDNLPNEAQMRQAGGEGWELSGADRATRLAEGGAEAREARAAEAARLQPTAMAPRTRPPEQIRADQGPVELRQNQFGDLTPEAPDSLTRATQKVERGRAFDLTAEERIALRGTASVWNRPKIATAAVVGATGLGLAMALEPDQQEAALAIGAGALLAGRGREPLTMAAIREIPDTAPLGSILDRSPYTLSSLEMLPKNRFEFSKDSVQQLLKRQEVTKAERDVLTKALETVPGDTITAKQLMMGVKEATGDFELNPADFTNVNPPPTYSGRQFSTLNEWGLTRIGRADRFSGAFEDIRDPAEFDGATARLSFDGRLWEVYDADGEYITNFMRDPTVADEASAIERARQENQNRIDGPASATTTIYQSPMEIGAGNHFDDPNYFAHTRSFVEGGVRHVVELQSDLAQKAGKALTSGERAELTAKKENAFAARDLVRTLDYHISRAGNFLNAEEWLKKFEQAKSDLERFYPGFVDDFDQTLYNRFQQSTEKSMQEAVDAWNLKSPGTHVNGDMHVGFTSWLNKNPYRQPVGGPVREAIQRTLSAAKEHLELIAQELSAKLGSTEIDPVRPILKDWYKRLVREEISRAASEAETRRAEQENYIAEKRRELKSAEDDFSLKQAPQPWALEKLRDIENQAYDLRVLAMDLKNGRVSEGTVRQYMLRTEAQLPPEGQAAWKDYFENNADETENFLRPGRGEDGEWGNSYASAFPKVMADFLDTARGNSPWLKSAKEHVDYLRQELAEAESRLKSGGAIRFATADTVAKVEGWPDIGDRNLNNARTNLADAERMVEFFKRQVKEFGSEEGRQEMLAGAQEKAATAKVKYEKALEESGKPQFRPEHQGIYDRYAKDVTKFLKSLGGKEVTDSKGVSWIEVPLEPKKGNAPLTRTQLFGVGAAATAGLAAILAEDGGEGGATGAALAGMMLFGKSRSPATASAASRAVKRADYLGGALATRLANIAPPIARRVRKHAGELMKYEFDLLQRVAPMAEGLRRLPKEVRGKLDSALFTGNRQAVLALLTPYPEALVAFSKARETLNELGRGLMETGKLKQLLPEYFPRIVVDRNGLLNYLGVESGTILQRRLRVAELRAQGRGEVLSELEKSQIIDKYLAESFRGQRKAGFLRNRKVDEVKEEMLAFYAPADEALLMYTQAAAKEIEAAKFFGKDLVRDGEGRMNKAASIGQVVQRELAGKTVTFDQIDEVHSMLNSYFGPGEQAMNANIAAARNTLYAMLLGNIGSAAVQLGDVVVAGAMHGILPTIKSAARVITGNQQRWTVRDFGLIEAVAEEFSGRTASARMLNTTFRWSGFNLADRFGKETALNASFSKNQRLAQTAKGQAELAKKYRDYFGEEDLGKLMSDLRSGTRSRLVQELLFSELSDLQPVSKAEMPQAYLDVPNGRMLYMLKTFMLKQADILRREVYNKMKRGETVEATKQLLKFGTAMGVAGASGEFFRNWLYGRDDELEWKDLSSNFLKTFMLSDFVLGKPTLGDKLQQFGGDLLPPIEVFAEVLRTAEKAGEAAGKGQLGTLQRGELKGVRYIPVIGAPLYHDRIPYFEELGIKFGGVERYNEAKRRREREQLRKELRDE